MRVSCGKSVRSVPSGVNVSCESERYIVCVMMNRSRSLTASIYDIAQLAVQLAKPSTCTAEEGGVSRSSELEGFSLAW